MTDPLVALQIGAESFQDEGIETVLDTVTGLAGVNALFLATPTWSLATGGRAEPGYAVPDHGVAADQAGWQGGSYATPHPQYYARTALGPVPSAGWDMLGEVTAAAAHRGVRSYAWIDESAHARALRAHPGFLAVLEVDMWNKPARRPCYRNPDYRNWHLGLVEDYIKSYSIDGLGWSTDRIGPLNLLLQGPARQGLGLVVCYCAHCKEAGAERGVDWRRAQQGHRRLVTLNAAVAAGDIPEDGSFVSYWRLLLSYPEMLAWQTLWTDGQHQMYRDIYGLVKAYRPEVSVGWTIDHADTLNPFFRAGQDLAEMSHFSDFLKVAVYDNAAGPRLHTAVDGLARSIFADAEPREVYPLLARMIGLDQPPAYDDLPDQGLPAGYVTTQTRRAVVGNEGRCKIYTGIDVNIPVGQPGEGRIEAAPGDSTEANPDRTTSRARSTPDTVEAAVLAAFAGGADGIVLSRKYSEMTLANLAAVGAALAERTS